MRLAGSRGSQEDDVLLLAQEVELGQVHHLVALHAALEGEIEVIQGLHLGKAGKTHPVLPAVRVTGGHLLRKDGGQISFVVPAFGPSLLGERFCGLADPGGLEGPRQIGDLRGGGHALTPRSAS